MDEGDEETRRVEEIAANGEFHFSHTEIASLRHFCIDARLATIFEQPIAVSEMSRDRLL
jgi:hypothetical protein